MKIINVTIFRSFNYGAVLQAYALHKKLNDLGHDCSILNFRPTQKEKRFIKVFQRSNNLKEFIVSLIAVLKFGESKRMINSANSFFFNNLKLTEPFKNYIELENNPPKADVFICGSDQIWNPKIHGVSPLYFLNFINNGDAIKASFAASVGENYIEKSYHKEIEKFLCDFDFISVREEKAKEILGVLTKKEILVVADPVFLLEKKDWMNLAVYPKIKKKYILCYLLYQPKYLNEFLKKIKKDTGYQIISVTPSPYSKIYKDKFIRDVGPDGFLGLIADAEMVITSSFHGTALSILLEKQFYSVVGNERGSRITNILGKLDLSSRIITDNSFYFKSDINYQDVNEGVNKIRENSLECIQKILDLKSE